ncbi:prenyltransferase, UbiA family protein [Beauveria bassiana ARSEF 2860]|uniref:Diterpenoid pyrone biosynthesis cluster protein C n=1 Tax=Beauveria bassiana (strain ARSEF 2860) TaxID=655819 RepID=J4UGN3_BEAB2|nr:prenyltransferase, UbiA family protein [Beauveria bassiana ARSEF 2860]EJP62077.1 prenyltransferase, UbiA family protein [Beauveria bassiana ARSEF 2860]
MSKTEVMSKTETVALVTAPTAAATGQESRLAQQFGGHYTSGWMNRLPAAWTPYIQLARLHRPHGLIVVTLAHLFGIFHAAFQLQSSLLETLRVSAIIIAGSIFCNSGAHAWNDLVDAPIDAQVERTKTRPIPRGAVTRTDAFVFAAAQAVLAAACLFPLPPSTIVTCVPSIAAILYYPFAKRQMFAPQLVLGISIGLCVLVGSAAMGIEKPWYDASTLCLATATMLWTILFDTIYAHMDLVDDVKLGVNSFAVFIQGYARPVLSLLAVGQITLLFAAGVYAAMGIAFYVTAVAGCFVCVGGIVTLLDLENRASCGKWCIFGFRFTGIAILTGLLVNYLV